MDPCHHRLLSDCANTCTGRSPMVSTEIIAIASTFVPRRAAVSSRRGATGALAEIEG